MAYIFGTKQVYTTGQVPCKLQGLSYIVSKRHELWSTNGFKLEVSFHPPYVNSAFHFIATAGFADKDQQTELNQTLPNGGR